MSTGLCRSARRSISSDLLQPLRGPGALSAAAWLGGVLCLLVSIQPAGASGNAEAELSLAKRRQLYVVVDPARGVVEIKIRGEAFTSLPLVDWGLFADADPGSPPPEIQLPNTFLVTGEPSVEARRITTVEVLRPYSEAASETPSSAAEPLPRPQSFELPLDGGWKLRTGPTLPETRGFAGWRARLADGWAAVNGESVPRPPLLALALDPDAAARLHHVLRPGTPILVLAPAAVQAPVD